jgi:hypothetical protein
MTMTLIESKTLTSAQASIEFTSIPQTFTDLVVLYSLRPTGTPNVDEIQLSFNASTSNFSNRVLQGNGSGVGSFTSLPRSIGFYQGTTASTFNNGSLYVPNYTSNVAKSYSVDTVTENNATLAYQTITAGLWNDTSAITSLALSLLSNTIEVASCVSLYGVLKGTDGIVTTS